MSEVGCIITLTGELEGTSKANGKQFGEFNLFKIFFCLFVNAFVTSEELTTMRARNKSF